MILHAVWKRETKHLYLWGEDKEVYDQLSKQTIFEEFHPFSLPTVRIREIIAPSTIISSSAISDSDITLELPSSSSAPLLSTTALIGTNASTETRFAHWKISALAINPYEALELLVELTKQKQRDMILGESLHYWAHIVGLALTLVNNQSFIPVLKKIDKTNAQIRWTPLLDAIDNEHMIALVKTMPAICWSHADTDTQVIDLISSFLEEMIHAFVKNNASTKRLTTIIAHTKNKLIKQCLQALIRTQQDETSAIQLSTAYDGVQATKLSKWLDVKLPSKRKRSFRPGFRLTEPSSKDGPWTLQFYLQASDNKSLTLLASEIWHPERYNLSFLKRIYGNFQATFLAQLRQLASYYPELGQALNQSNPSMMELSTEKAYFFLQAIVPILDTFGFDAQLPAWCYKQRKRLEVTLQIKQGTKATDSLMSLGSLLHYDWTLSLGQEKLSEEELAELVASSAAPMIKLRGQWIEVEQHEIASITQLRKSKEKKELNVGQALRIVLGNDMHQFEEKSFTAISTIEIDSNVQNFLDSLMQSQEIPLLETPKDFIGSLRPYQQRGFSWLHFLKGKGLGACLADDMGLGKTIQIIVLLLRQKDSQETEPNLLICPMSVLGNWQKEIQRFAPNLKVFVHYGTSRTLQEEIFKKCIVQYDLILTSYAIAAKDIALLRTYTWNSIIIDEAQHIKNASAKQAQAIKQLSGRFKTALTGTPVENRLAELWSIMDFLNTGYLGSEKSFRSRFGVPIERYNNKEQAEILKKIIQPFVLRRLKTDRNIIQDLPDKIETKVFCPLTKEQASLYQNTVQEMLTHISSAKGIQRKGLILSAILKFKQICNHPVLFTKSFSALNNRSGKLKYLEELLSSILSAQEKVLIFTQFSSMGELLANYLKEACKTEVLYLHGGTPKHSRDSMIDSFQSKDGPSLFVLSLKAGGIGLNLTQANHVIHYDRWWNPAVENQATDRAFRIGQTKIVHVHKFICAGTIEDRIDQLIEKKKRLADFVITQGEGWITEMSTQELAELFTLAAGNVVDQGD